MVTTFRLSRELEGEKDGLRESGRFLGPLKSLQTLPPIYGESEFVDNEALIEDDGVRARFLIVACEVFGDCSVAPVGKKREATVATSIVYSKRKRK